MFTLAQTASALNKSAHFDRHAEQFKDLSLPRNEFVPMIAALERGDIVGRTVEDVAATVQAAVLVASFHGPKDPTTDTRFRDILEMLNIQVPADRERRAPVVRALEQFSAKVTQLQTASQTERMQAVSGRSYDLVTTPGCIAFLESQFIFMLRSNGAAAPCEPAR